jgi:hypothetical protein
MRCSGIDFKGIPSVGFLFTLLASISSLLGSDDFRGDFIESDTKAKDDEHLITSPTIRKDEN